MFGSSTLDIAIGVIFVFLLLSIFATAINEIILSAVNLRGKFLLRGIQSLLNEEPDTPAAAAGSPLVTRIYSHGLICGLYKGEFDLKKKGDLPSYIPASNFAQALLDTAEQYSPALLSVDDATKKVEELKAATPIDDTKLIIAKALLESAQYVATKKAQAAATPPPSNGATQQPTANVAVQNIVAISQLCRVGAVALAADPMTAKVGKPLVSMIASAGGDAAKLRASVEAWYNSGMDRVSGWYKYRTQWVLFGIGIVMAVVLNANTINIVRKLSIDPTLRQSIVAAAQSAKPPAEGSSDLPIQKQIQAANGAFDDIKDLGLPLGWDHGAPSLKRVWQTRSPPWESLLGWILTAIAISMGAPFWFDALNKIMVIRSTVKPKEKSPDEKSKS